MIVQMASPCDLCLAICNLKCTDCASVFVGGVTLRPMPPTLQIVLCILNFALCILHFAVYTGELKSCASSSSLSPPSPISLIQSSFQFGHRYLYFQYGARLLHQLHCKKADCDAATFMLGLLATKYTDGPINSG